MHVAPIVSRHADSIHGLAIRPPPISNGNPDTITAIMASLQLPHKDGLWPHSLALCDSLAVYGCGWLMITSSSMAVNLAGVLLPDHAMAISAHLIRECAHNTLFAVIQYNTRLGAALDWITGSCYARYHGLHREHLRHHVEHAAVIGFDYRRGVRAYPWLGLKDIRVGIAADPFVERRLVKELPTNSSATGTGNGRPISSASSRGKSNATTIHSKNYPMNSLPSFRRRSQSSNPAIQQSTKSNTLYLRSPPH